MTSEPAKLTVLWATDGSHQAKSAFGLFREMILPVTGRLVVLTVAPHAILSPARPDPVFLTKVTRTARAHALTEAHQACEREVLALDPDVPVEIITRWGHPVEEILRAANAARADLIVMAAKGHTNFHLLLLGSVSQGVAHHATRPLLIARPGANEVKTVMIAYHGSANARKALRFLKRLSLPADSRLVLVNVVEPFTLPEGTPPAYRRQALTEAHEVNEGRKREATQRLEALVNELRGEGLVAEYEVLAGDAALELDAAARRLNADLIVVGSSKASPSEHYLLGSTTEKLVRHSHTSVLVVR
jgi:nucleotide-binding universal stress UspA family protein